MLFIRLIKLGNKQQSKIQVANLMLKLFNANFVEESTNVRKSYAQPMERNVKIVAKATTLQSNVQREREKQNQIDDDTDSVESVDMVNIEQLVYTIKNTKIFADMMVRSTTEQVSFQIDTGSSVNILPIKFMPKDKEVSKTPIILKSWTGNKITPVGSARIVIESPSNSKKYRLTFIIVKEDLSPILGLRASEAMNLLTIDNDNFKEARINEITVQSEEDIVLVFQLYLMMVLAVYQENSI